MVINNIQLYCFNCVPWVVGWFVSYMVINNIQLYCFNCVPWVVGWFVSYIVINNIVILFQLRPLGGVMVCELYGYQ